MVRNLAMRFTITVWPPSHMASLHLDHLYNMTTFTNRTLLVGPLLQYDTIYKVKHCISEHVPYICLPSLIETKIIRQTHFMMIIASIVAQPARGKLQFIFDEF